MLLAEFTINGRTEGARVSDVTAGMDVTFEYDGIAETEPPQAVRLTFVDVSGKVRIDPEVIRHALAGDAARRQARGPET